MNHSQFRSLKKIGAELLYKKYLLQFFSFLLHLCL
ncbi:hypothetical protein EVA_12919 [gut metagenome]|uniref:Uncharacterized protein n=1 Tax=gut metagenome TaxID=749906 RepID=J9FWQ6_9ZZZZ